MAGKYSFHKGIKKQSNCQSGCCSEIKNAAAALTCGCCAEKAEVVNEQAGAAACGCCIDGEPVEQIEATPEARETTSNFAVKGLDCGDCAVKLEKGIGRMKGIIRVQVNFATAKMKVTYDPGIVDAAAIIEKAGRLGYSAVPAVISAGQAGIHKTIFMVSGLDCADCAATLEKKILSLTGIYSAQINFATSKLIVEHTASEADIVKVVRQAGYDAKREGDSKSPDSRPEWWKNRRTQTTAVAGILLILAVAMEWLGVSDNVIVPLYVATALVGGYSSAKSAFYGFRSLSFDMNTLMTMAVIGALCIGEWSEAATVAFLFSFGNTLQTYTMDKTRQSIRALMELAPPEALVRRNGQEEKLPVEEIVVGDIIIVKPGERIAMDGIVRDGMSAVNQATITGESVPVEKHNGDFVYAGTVNEHGVLEVEVTKIAADSTLAKIMHLVEEAQAQKAPSQQFVDKFSRYYSPAVLLAAAGIMVIPWLFFGLPFTEWFYRGLVLLVISCPCALVISTPVSIVSAIGNASRNGVLIKGGAYLEQMGAMQSIAFDKTGTLTHGRPSVTDIVPTDGITEAEFLTMAASVERLSEHPLAIAIVEKAKGLALKTVTNFKALVGRGAQAEFEGKTIYIGNPRLFEELGFDLSSYHNDLENLQRQGKTVMLMGNAEQICGLIAVADTLRANSIEAIQALHQTGMQHVAMLTGDNDCVAASIAGQLKLDAFYSELLPEDKVKTVKCLMSQYGSVAMVGDGVNDAPALAVANVGIAMGVAGADSALETADIALMSDNLGKLSYLVHLSRKTVAIIKQNIVFSIAIKLVFIILTFAGYVNLWLAVFADMGSSILVTLNGMRLMRLLR
ncbi:putative membrane protein [Propionispora sp. 2/2-37]|uniref:heavy metal translocating P-type ATPase n=1 Tax=Propionispora sp. 2/2-37 TaxID=1677858 RepID=UPI0006C3DED1|nr:heavy metal translocating P-type ATPase [Propionispora sp. 2/2-37]CUH95544.1 putative membrane protein [Propionispora sp. 2/2-37]